MKYRITAIRDLGAALLDLKSQVHDPRHLRVGRDYKSVAMRPRELLGNWLFCVVLNEATGRNWTLSEDPTGGDGAMLDRDTGTGFLTEHVFVPPPNARTKGTVEEQIIAAIVKKAAKGEAYAKGKTLVVFSEAVGTWLPNRVGRVIDGTHYFEGVWAVGLHDVEDGEYLYWVTRLDPVHSPAWRIKISEAFDSWSVSPIQ